MTLFFDENVYVGDRMFDLNRGFGRVIQVHNTSIELDFEGKKIIYSLTGIQKGKTLRSLFWSQPYIIAPTKDAEHWVHTKNKFDAILNVLKNSY